MHTGKKLLLGEIKDISVSGALIRCEELPSPEETLELSIEVAELSYVFALVENVRFNIDDSQGESIAYELAVRFKDMTEDERKVLYNAIEQEVMKKN
jgi:hypothetical protein